MLTGAAAPPPGAQPVCTVGDPRLAELSGLVVEGPPGGAPQRYHAIVDGGGTARTFTLDPAGCAVTGTRSADVPVTDVEDLGLGPGGELWLADTGDNGAQRASVRLVVLPPAGPPRVHDLAYPDGPRDVEALLVGDDGVPLLVDKTTGAAGVYRPARPLHDGGDYTASVPLERVGQVVLPWSGTGGGPLGAAGSRTVTGGGVSPAGAAGGQAGVLRTYTDAWVFPLPPGVPATADTLVAALGRAPLPVPLPDEAQGEAIAPDGRGALHSGSEARGPTAAAITVVPGAVGAATAPQAPVVAQPAEVPEYRSYPSWLPAVGGAAAVGVLLLAGAVAMALHGRRRRSR
ncbi:hypothetical protein [Pseudonocardia sp. ICBG1293]|uniref:hypothetical protein n=1 Tax=Pseudonocardia sp. ICBG1293 TaxID=2844382 RepID=UPI001CC9FF86|nr:hypothetical protein [Pseudonocardia sp. ICBG1293]